MNKYRLPEIRIKNAWLLRESASRHLHTLFAEEGAEMANHAEIDEIVEAVLPAVVPDETLDRYRKLLSAAVPVPDYFECTSA